MKKPNIKKYYIKNNIVYLLKETPKKNYFLRLSPPFKRGKDRRIFIVKKKDFDGYKIISPQKAQEIVNKKWRESEEEWIFNGKTYKVLDCSDPKSSFDKVIIPIWIKIDENNYFYCYNQGKVCLGELYPGGVQTRVRLYKFKTIENNKITITGNIKWTNLKNCKVIYEVLPNGDLKMI